MKNVKRITALLLILLLCGNLCACVSTLTPDISYHDEEFFAMDTVMSVRVYTDHDGSESMELRRIVEELDRELSASSEDGALSQLNRTGQTDNAHIAELCRRGAELSARTDGALDLTLLPASRLWGFPDKSYRIPAAEEISELRDVTGMDKLHVTDGAVRIDAGSAVDLGSLAKGYAADLCRKQMEDRKLCGILSLGGNLQTVGSKPDGSDWRIGIKDPFSPDENMCVVSIADKAVVTSGNYERYFEQDGKVYWHIIDPADGCPADNGLVSVTIIGSKGLQCDALSTALFVMGTDRAQTYLADHTDVEAVLVTDDGRLLYTDGLREKLDITGDMPSEVIARD